MVNNILLNLYGDRYLVTSLIVVIISQCMQMLNHYVISLKLTKYCISTAFQFLKTGKKDTEWLHGLKY